MRKICFLLILFALLTTYNVQQGFCITRLYDRVVGGTIDADKDDAEWDNTNNEINTHEADTSAHGATGGVVGVSKTQTLTNKTISNLITTGTATIPTFVTTSYGTIENLTVTSITPNAILAALSAGQFSNCGMTYASDTLSITDEAGAALSATNPCCIGVAGATAGQNGTVCFTAPVSSTFAATSNTDGNTFGVTATVNWANDLPVFLYACRGSASNYFGFSRQPNKTSTGAAATDMCQEGDEDCDAQGDLFLMTSGLTLASEVNMPCQVVGSFTMQWDTTNDHWDVTALDAADGFGRYQSGVAFLYPLGQNGAAASSYLSSTGNQIPTWAASASIIYTYTITRDGNVNIIFSTGAAGNCTQDGAAGADAISFALPYATASSLAGVYDILVGTARTGGAVQYGAGLTLAANSSNLALTQFTNTGTYSSVQENSWGDVSDDLMIYFTFRAF